LEKSYEEFYLNEDIHNNDGPYSSNMMIDKKVSFLFRIKMQN
jgi:hypothetical protein